jgi:hypothetical protein
MARKWLVIVLADLGDACQANSDLPAAAEAWRQALQVLDDLRLPDDMGIRARLEQAGLELPDSMGARARPHQANPTG